MSILFFIGIICLIVFLFTIYKIAKDDFVFLRKNISLEEIFNALFLALPIVLFSSRILYIVMHPSVRYLNPLIFLAVPYFPGLSTVGGIFGSWIFIQLYCMRKKIPSGRLLDMISIAFLLSFSLGIFLQGILFFLSNKLLGIEEIGRSMLGIAFFIFILLQFLKNTWQEGLAAYLAIIFYTLLSLVSVGFTVLSHKSIPFTSLTVTSILFALSFFIFLFKTNPLAKLVK